MHAVGTLPPDLRPESHARALAARMLLVRAESCGTMRICLKKTVCGFEERVEG